MASWQPPTVADFKARWNRDFPYAPAEDPDNLKFVCNTDIQRAIDEALVNFSTWLFGDNTTLIFMWLAAHYLVVNIRNSGMGLASQSKFALNSTSVGGVNINNNINDRFAGDPMFAQYLTTGYGQQYLQLVYPYTVGAGVNVVKGTTTFA